MTPDQVPYLCGGILFSLLLQARKTRTKARNRCNSGSDGLNDTDLMMGLVEIVTGDSFVPCQGKTFGKATTQFKTCQEYGPTYIPFTESAVIDAFNDSLKKNNSGILVRMSEFINRFINEQRSEWFVKALFEVIQNDAEILPGTYFSISSDYEVPKDEFDSITEVDLPIFLLSVLRFILNERPDNTKGRPTFEAWHIQSGPKSPWKYNGHVGDSITRTITVNVKLESDETKADNPAPETPGKTPTQRINEKILAAGQVLADVMGKAIENLADELDGKSLSGQSSADFPYSPEDKPLLQEFASDYDEIMMALIGENYAASLIDMTLPCKIQDLYKTKWSSKADHFQDPSLKSYVFGLLGELNNISNDYLTNGDNISSHKINRSKIRNLYVKLHPESFAGSFPYDAFIDDWNDGEY